MEVNELRIGNFIQINIFGYYYYYVAVTGILPDKLYYSLHLNDLRFVDFFAAIKCYWEPIELTDTWLADFGFTNDTVFKREGFEIFYSTTNKCYQVLNFTIGSDFVHKVNIEYVHQLQNIYYTLTGKELIYL